jgi:uncharacterized membrane protein HdeD (DUF308 family)
MAAPSSSDLQPTLLAGLEENAGTAIAGGYLVNQPLVGLADITIVLMAFFIVTGIFELIAGLQIRLAEGWGRMMLTGWTLGAIGTALRRKKAETSAQR